MTWVLVVVMLASVVYVVRIVGLNRDIMTTKAQLVQVQRCGEELETEKYRQEFKRKK